jgi:nitrilase
VTEFPTVRVAALQATPVILDAEASVEKAVRLLAEAAADGVRLAVLPETFLSLYPSNIWARRASGFGGFDELWERLWASSVDVPGPLVDRLLEACREHDMHCAIGVNERESQRPGTLYNALLLIGPGGLISKHRKLMPTHHERLFHGIGPGDDLSVAETPVGRVGGLICWENRMPLARWAVYEQGPQIWVAPTADDSDGWIASMRHIAIESGAYVVSAPQYIPRSAFPKDFPVELPDREVLGNGGAAIVEPTGDVVAGPLYGEEGTVVADCDLRHGLHAKRSFDVVGHYSRGEVLAPPPTKRAFEGDGGEPDGVRRAPADS